MRCQQAAPADAENASEPAEYVAICAAALDCSPNDTLAQHVMVFSVLSVYSVVHS